MVTKYGSCLSSCLTRQSNLRPNVFFCCIHRAIKEDLSEPEFIEYCNITSLYKGIGDRSSLENERGIFLLSILRMIKDHLIYNDIFKKVDQSISDSQVGGRSKRSIRDHLFVLHSVINSIVQKELPCVDLQFYDVKSCFDSLWTEECGNDLYEAGITDDKLAMIYLGNIEKKVDVKCQYSNRFIRSNLHTKYSMPGRSDGKFIVWNSVENLL